MAGCQGAQPGPCSAPWVLPPTGKGGSAAGCGRGLCRVLAQTATG